jgi:hypothetical protein
MSIGVSSGSVVSVGADYRTLPVRRETIGPGPRSATAFCHVCMGGLVDSNTVSLKVAARIATLRSQQDDLWTVGSGAHERTNSHPMTE